jgi:hypothetical protein
MSYAPTVNNRSGEIFAKGIDDIGDALKTIGEHRQQSRAADSTMDMLMQMNPEALPRNADTGDVDSEFLTKFYGAPLKAKQQMLGLVASQIIGPKDAAEIGFTNARTGLVNSQTDQVNAETDATNTAKQDTTTRAKTLDKWAQRLKTGAKGAAGAPGRTVPMSSANHALFNGPPLPTNEDVLGGPALPPLP